MTQASVEPVLAQRNGIAPERVVGVDEQLGAAPRARPRPARRGPGTMRASSNSTAETSTAAVRSSTAAASRSASVSTGRAGTRTTSSPSSRQPRELAAQRVELAVGGDEPRPARAGRAPTGSAATRSCVLAPSAISPRGSSSSARKPSRTRSALRERALPLVVDVQRGVVERLDLPLERDVRPRLVRVAGEQQPLGDAEARVVARRAGSPRRELTARLRIAHRSGNAGWSSVDAQVLRARRAAGAAPCRRSCARTIFTWR